MGGRRRLSRALNSNQDTLPCQFIFFFFCKQAANRRHEATAKTYNFATTWIGYCKHENQRALQRMGSIEKLS